MKKALIVLMIVLTLALHGCESEGKGVKQSPTPTPSVSYAAKVFNSLAELRNAIGVERSNGEDSQDAHNLKGLNFFYQIKSSENLILSSIEIRSGYVALNYGENTIGHSELEKVFLVTHRAENGEKYLENYVKNVKGEKVNDHYEKSIKNTDDEIVGKNFYFVKDNTMLHLYLPMEFLQLEIEIEKVTI